MKTHLAIPILATVAAMTSVSAFGETPPTLGPAPLPSAKEMEAAHSVLAMVPKAALSPLAVNRLSRTDSANFYKDVYVPTELATDWVGSLSPGCNAGSTSAAYRDGTLDRLNYFRAMTGLPGNVVFDAAWDSSGQQAALVVAANNTLNHTPPNTSLCYTQAAFDASGRSNLALGSGGGGNASGPKAVKIYMDDFGGGNEAIGHRRWVLYPPQAVMGTGSAGLAGSTNSNALRTFGPGNFGSRPATPNGVAWPPEGFVPYQVLPWDPFFGTQARWSFSYPSASFGAASVTVTSNGSTVPTTILPLSENTYGDNTMVWQINVPPNVPTFDTRYNVSITGIAGAPFTSISYTVTVFDPNRPLSFRLDTNGDGKGDVLFRNAAGTNYLWNVNGATITGGILQIASQGLLPSVDSTWTVAGIGDFNGDGKSDILWRKNDGTNYVWHVNGAVIAGGVLQIASQGLLPTVDTSWSVAGLGDFNGDGKSDVFWRKSDGTNYVWHVNGSVVSGGLLQITTQGLLPTVDSTWTVAATGDYNGDGKSDVFFRKSDGTNYVWHVNGSVISGGLLQISSQGLLPAVDTSWSVAGSGDYNGDGKSDILWRRTDGTNFVWHINGSTISGGLLSIASQGLLPSVDSSWSVPNPR